MHLRVTEMNTRHNYIRVMQAMIVAGEIPTGIGLSKLDVYHDDDCAIFDGGFCDCECVVEYNPVED